MKEKTCTGSKIISIILGAIVGGFMWRCRGDGGFGSSCFSSITSTATARA